MSKIVIELPEGACRYYGFVAFFDSKGKMLYPELRLNSVSVPGDVHTFTLVSHESSE